MNTSAQDNIERILNTLDGKPSFSDEDTQPMAAVDLDARPYANYSVPELLELKALAEQAFDGIDDDGTETAERMLEGFQRVMDNAETELFRRIPQALTTEEEDAIGFIYYYELKGDALTLTDKRPIVHL